MDSGFFKSWTLGKEPYVWVYLSDKPAIETSLLTESQFTNTKVLMWKKFVALVDALKGDRVKVHIFPTMHVHISSYHWEHIGIATILQSPMPELIDLNNN